MKAPDSFLLGLSRQFDGQLRIRWSIKRKRWQIEQQVDCYRVPPIQIEAEDDDAIRAFDGFSPVMEVTQGTITPCPDCGRDCKVPSFVTASVHCLHCRRDGHRGKFIAGYWPLNDTLLEHLRSIDPNRGVFERRREKERDRLMRIREQRFASAFREADACAVDDAKVDIAKTSLANRTAMWSDAPPSLYQ